MKETIDLSTITPNFEEDFDINKVLEDVDKTISNSNEDDPIENITKTKMFLWLLRHYISSNKNAPETDKEQPKFTEHEYNLICKGLNQLEITSGRVFYVLNRSVKKG